MTKFIGKNILETTWNVPFKITPNLSKTKNQTEQYYVFLSDPDWRSIWVLVSELFPWLCKHRQTGGKVDSSWEFSLHKGSLMSLSSDWQADIKTPAESGGWEGL